MFVSGFEATLGYECWKQQAGYEFCGLGTEAQVQDYVGQLSVSVTNHR